MEVGEAVTGTATDSRATVSKGALSGETERGRVGEPPPLVACDLHNRAKRVAARSRATLRRCSRGALYSIQRASPSKKRLMPRREAGRAVGEGAGSG